MAHDSSVNLQIFSPTGSGRSSPSPRVTRNHAEDALQKKDKGFRRYAAGVERALALWDAAQQEWADYISFLGRLLKVNMSIWLMEKNCAHVVVFRLCNLILLRRQSFPIAMQSHSD
ncbi:hypothetical protein PMIN07_008509 [Paraphaeosphaeria minitans]